MAKKRITRVTTRRGDSGKTSLADGSEIGKDEPRIHTIGSVDELNSFIGVLLIELDSKSPVRAVMERLQQELFDLGAHLATSGAVPAPAFDWVEEAVGAYNAELPPLTEFVIPGGTRASAFAHICRTVCRRAERDAWSMGDADAAARYLNRLSDLFFVIARLQNAGTEPQWRGLER